MKIAEEDGVATGCRDLAGGDCVFRMKTAPSEKTEGAVMYEDVLLCFQGHDFIDAPLMSGFTGEFRAQPGICNL